MTISSIFSRSSKARRGDSHPAILPDFDDKRRRRLSNPQFPVLLVLSFGLLLLLCEIRIGSKLSLPSQIGCFSNETSKAELVPQSHDELVPQSNDELVPQSNDQNDPKIIHLIRTRFMQNQPNLTTLGMARFKLLEAFTFPSIINQSNQNFLWVIRTDPDLDLELRRMLLDLVKDVPNCLVIASNEDPRGIKCAKCMDGVSKETVWSGDLNIFEDYYRAARDTESIVLDTKLDADDALYLDFVDDIRKAVSSQMQSPKDFRIFCAKYHVGWHFLPSSLMESTPVPVPTSEKGMIKSKDDTFCISAGLTFAYGSEVTLEAIQYVPPSHVKVHDSLPQCNGTFPSGDTPSSVHNQAHCLMEIVPQSSLPAAVRARCPTSNSMVDVDVESKLKNLNEYKFLREQERSWMLLQHQFGMDPSTLWEIQSNYMQTALEALVVEQLSGMCQPGFSCRDPAKEALQNLVSSGQ